MSGEKYGTNQSVPHVDLHTTAEELAAAVKEAKEYADSLLETDGE
jgi:hypothetical protein